MMASAHERFVRPSMKDRVFKIRYVDGIDRSIVAFVQDAQSQGETRSEQWPVMVIDLLLSKSREAAHLGMEQSIPSWIVQFWRQSRKRRFDQRDAVVW